jgi:hypothetical protein
MDYLTQHYKNLSEQLQAKVNHLNNLLSEVVITKVTPVYTRQGTTTKPERIDTEKGEKFIDVDTKRELVTFGGSQWDNSTDLQRRRIANARNRSESEDYHKDNDIETSPGAGNVRTGVTTAEERQRAQQQANIDERKKRSENQGEVGPSAGRKSLEDEKKVQAAKLEQSKQRELEIEREKEQRRRADDRGAPHG